MKKFNQWFYSYATPQNLKAAFVFLTVVAALAGFTPDSPSAGSGIGSG